MRTRVKICGVMRGEDALAAARLGADAIGMIFHPPARRNIEVLAARQIVAALGPFVTPVGVFVDAPTSIISDIVAAVGLRTVQLHGHETPDQVAELGALGFRVLKAIRVDDGIESELMRWHAAMNTVGETLMALVLETPNATGGSGQANDWAAIIRHRASGHFDGLPPIIAAGGLFPETVYDVVQSVRPWAVDVSSGVESTLGRKSAEKISAFVAEVRRADE